jgi:eukaryotic-like serine/threonine-protein kinase
VEAQQFVQTLETFGPYILMNRVNVGGMAEVFRAVDSRSQRIVALKRLLPLFQNNADYIGMFHDEAMLTAQLKHPNIVSVFDVGEHQGTAYLVMEYLASKDAREIFDRAMETWGRVPLEMALAIGMATSRCLAYAHQKTNERGQSLGIIHRDISLPNILVGFDGDIKLIDFGIAKALGRLAMTETGMIKGKYAYLSPELALGKPFDHRTDIFSLGVCLWELLTGRRLFYTSNDAAVLQKIRSCKVPPPSQVELSVPKEIDRIVLKALAKNVDERYATAADLFADLSAFGHNAGGAAHRQRLAQLMRELFPNDSAQITNTVSVTESAMESLDMAENKGGSDLDVFEGLARKSNRLPSLQPPPSGQPSVRPPGGLPPPVSQPGMPVRPKTMLGLAPPPMGNVTPPAPSRPPMPPPPKSIPPMPPPSMRGGAPLSMPRPSGQLPQVMPPPRSGMPSISGAGVPAPLPPPQAPSAQAGGVDMDWDDEDEKTAIYDKSATEEALRNLEAGLSSNNKPPPAAGMPASRPNLGSAASVASSRGASATPLPVPSRPPVVAAPPQAATTPASAGVATQQPVQAVAVPVDARNEPTQIVRPAKQGSSKAGYIALGFVALAAAGAFFFYSTRPGKLVIEVKDGQKAVDNIEVTLDGKKAACQNSPCTIDGISKGAHTIEATAAGFQRGTKSVQLNAGEEAIVSLTLTSEVKPEKKPVEEVVSGFKVNGASFVKMSLDGKEIGPLPQIVKNAEPGEHKVKFFASDLYEPKEMSVTVAKGETKDLGDIKLKVIKGKVKLSLATMGARVVLVSGKERRAVRQFPVTIDIDTKQTWSIEASKVGFIDYKADITFDDGEAEKTFTIDLQEKGKPPKKTEDTKGPTSTKEKDDPKAKAGGQAKLNIISIPPSNVILDARPIGMTPLFAYPVSPGTHTIVFINPDKGKKTLIIGVRPGETKPAAVKF